MTRTVVVKCGGSILHDESAVQNILNNVALLRAQQDNVVLVHGGGPKINNLLSRLGIQSKHISGIRVLDRETMELSEMLLCGSISKSLVGRLQTNGVDAIGLSGRDLGLFSVKPYKGQPELYGYSGEIEKIESEKFNIFFEAGVVPVFSPVGQDRQGQPYMLDADHLAAELAVALQADELFFLTNTQGFLTDTNDPNSTVRQLTTDEAEQYLSHSDAFGGMLPKLENSLRVVRGCEARVYILHARMESPLTGVPRGDFVGTEVVG